MEKEMNIFNNYVLILLFVDLWLFMHVIVEWPRFVWRKIEVLGSFGTPPMTSDALITNIVSKKLNK